MTESPQLSAVEIAERRLGLGQDVESADPGRIERPQTLGKRGVHIDALFKQPFHSVEVALDDCRGQPGPLAGLLRGQPGRAGNGKRENRRNQPAVHFEAASPGFAMQ